MERRSGHTVDVIRSQKGVTVYSMVNHGEIDMQRNREEFESFVDARDKITGELEMQYKFITIFGGMTKVEKAAVALLILKDVITNVTNTSGGMDKDVLPILGIIGLWAITSFAHDTNHNNSILARHKLKAVKEAEKRGVPQYEQIFPLHTDEN